MEKSSISQLANSSFASQFYSPNRDPQNTCLVPIQHDRVDMLHSLFTARQAESSEKPLLLHSAFHNSPASAVYLLRRGINSQSSDNEGRTLFHVCAYTGHMEVLKAVRNELKLARIQQLNNQYVSLLNNSNYKRTDVKGGKLKMSVSAPRQKAFELMQGAVGDAYEKYVMDLVKDTFEVLATALKSTNRNCFHLASLNRFQGCYNTLEVMFEELADINLHLDATALHLYHQVNACLPENSRIDPRLFQNTLSLIEETISESRLQEFRKAVTKKIEGEVEVILSCKDKDGQTPLHIASKVGCTGIINLIRKWEKSRKGENRQELIRVACHNLARSHIMDLCEASKEANSETMNFLLSCGEEINKKKTIFGTFPLLEAVKAFEKNKNLEPLQMLITSGAELNEQDTNGWTILHHACEWGLIEVLELVFKIWQDGKTKKVQLNKLTNKNYHLLHIAAMNNQSAIIDFLLTSPIARKLDLNPSAVDGDCCTMLHHAARRGATKALQKILEKSPQLLYEVDIGRNSALHYAAMNNHIDSIKYLLYFDSDFDQLQALKNSRGKLARDLTVNKKPFESIFSAARSGDVNQVRKMFNESSSLKSLCTPGKVRSLLMLAVLQQHLLVVKFLIEQGCDPTLKDKFGKTARDYGEEALKGCKSKQEQVVARNILSLFS